ncbi:hypothetical protein NDU88_004684 [Pleurodeles waltl]|uniref:Uncharacterized protein n=1 Tax=Pleurodeles waltl TaxID=8319 RepID=A0AAV7VHS1_PLEWA|nr:hypothetical protein NDU88_004684 [Pleurodeles waltl]
MLTQILGELHAMKVSQEEANRKIDYQLGQLNTNLAQLSAGASQAKQRVSDWEDAETRHGSAIAQMQTELEELQLKLDDIENRSRCSNLRFTGIPEEFKATSSATKVISDLIYKYILPEKATFNIDLSIMWTHRVPTVKVPTAKYPCTILVNFGDFRIKEQVLSQAFKTKVFCTTENFSFCAFPDMSISAA